MISQIPEIVVLHSTRFVVLREEPVGLREPWRGAWEIEDADFR
ncbi:MAG: hypothetical protein ACRESZ_07170 [Methylococcales bacterium]